MTRPLPCSLPLQCRFHDAAEDGDGGWGDDDDPLNGMLAEVAAAKPKPARPASAKPEAFLGAKPMKLGAQKLGAQKLTSKPPEDEW